MQWRHADLDTPIDDDGCRVDVQYQYISQGRIANVTFAPWREYDGRGFVCHAAISLQVPPYIYGLTLHSEVEAISEETGVRNSAILSFILFNKLSRSRWLFNVFRKQCHLNGGF